MTASPEAALLSLAAEARRAARGDPFANPALSAALALSRQLDDGALSLEEMAGMVAALGRSAFRDRAAGLARKTGLAGATPADAALAMLATRAARPDPSDSPVPL
ncbi:phosphoenolpyruvate carboxylase, partial [Roseomonas ludipueritiae]|nr:phosphoenolpyruvate carboxylase [Pseudoroseomonas ludipueritiae]